MPKTNFLLITVQEKREWVPKALVMSRLKQLQRLGNDADLGSQVCIKNQRMHSEKNKRRTTHAMVASDKTLRHRKIKWNQYY